MKIRVFRCMCQHPRWTRDGSNDGYCQNCDNAIPEKWFLEMEASGSREE